MMPESNYPANWPAISRAIRDRSGGQCECTGECGLHRGNRCEERDRTKAVWAAGQVVLTVAHRNHSPADCRPENLMALCNTCHLRYDRVMHLSRQQASRRAAVGCDDLFETTPPTP